MSKAPGHQKWPQHELREKRLAQRIQARVGGEIVADSTDVLKLEEDKYPARYYFPRADASMKALERSETTSECPFKGTAHYYHLVVGDKRFDDAVWTYEDPYDEHLELKDRLCFYDDKISQIEISPKA